MLASAQLPIEDRPWAVALDGDGGQQHHWQCEDQQRHRHHHVKATPQRGLGAALLRNAGCGEPIQGQALAFYALKGAFIELIIGQQPHASLAAMVAQVGIQAVQIAGDDRPDLGCAQPVGPERLGQVGPAGQGQHQVE